MSGWIGVDFDGTLAHYDGWQGPLTFGEPIPAMVERVKAWLAAGYEIRVVTARVSPQDITLAEARDVIEALNQWILLHIGQPLSLTASKDFDMIELWDDRCIQVVQNTGRPVDGQVSRTVGPPIQKWRYCARCNTMDAEPTKDYCAYCLQLSPEDFAKPFSQEEADTVKM